MGKQTICICENKDADQLRGNREADQRLCFRFSESTIPLLLKSEISSFYVSSVTVQSGLCRTCSKTTMLVFPRGGSNTVVARKMHVSVEANICRLHGVCAGHRQLIKAPSDRTEFFKFSTIINFVIIIIITSEKHVHEKYYHLKPHLCIVNLRYIWVYLY